MKFKIFASIAVLLLLFGLYACTLDNSSDQPYQEAPVDFSN